jgi:hypothetical protein
MGNGMRSSPRQDGGREFVHVIRLHENRIALLKAVKGHEWGHGADVLDRSALTL